MGKKSIKKLISAILIAAVALTVFYIPVYAAGYAVALSQNSQFVKEDEFAYVDLVFSGDKAYNSGSISLSYDSQYLEFSAEESAFPASKTIDISGDKLIIKFFGSDNALNSSFKLAFKALKQGSTEVKLTEAKIDSWANADSQSAPAATITNGSISIRIVDKSITGYSVILPDWFSGPEKAGIGEDYTFTAKDTNYEYTFDGTTMGGKTVNVKQNENGSFTIEQVFGDLIINAKREGKTFKVSLSGSARPDMSGDSTAQYMKDYFVTLNRQANYDYETPEITINGETFTGFYAENGGYRIPGNAITGPIVIKIGRKSSTAENGSLVVVGTGANDIEAPTELKIGEDYTFRLNKKTGYTYEIKATIDGKEVEVIDNGDGTYTIKKISGKLELTVTRTAEINLEVYEYLKLKDGRVMYLIVLEGPDPEEQVYTYDENVMYKVGDYEGYAWLEISDLTLVEIKTTVTEKIDAIDGTTENVEHDGDIDGNGKADAADLTIIRGMYNAAYDGFGQYNVRTFLRADVNNDHSINIMDCEAVCYAMAD